MARTSGRILICLLAAISLFYLILALVAEFGINSVPVGFASIDITPGSMGPARIGILWTAVTLVLFVIERLTLRQP